MMARDRGGNVDDDWKSLRIRCRCRSSLSLGDDDAGVVVVVADEERQGEVSGGERGEFICGFDFQNARVASEND